MITAIHTLIYSDDPAATRAFFRDVIQWPHVAEPDEQGKPSDWLIFRAGPSELGVHPTGEPGSPHHTPRQHQITLMCDDLEATMSELASRGAELAGEPMDAGFGRIVMVRVPGADDVMLYEPRHATAYGLDA